VGTISEEFGIHTCPKCGFVGDVSKFDYGGSEERTVFCNKCNCEFDLDTGKEYKGGLELSKNKFWKPEQEAMHDENSDAYRLRQRLYTRVSDMNIEGHITEAEFENLTNEIQMLADDVVSLRTMCRKYGVDDAL
jgi:hypothetical protein